MAEAYEKSSMANSSTYLGEFGDESQLNKSHSPRLYIRANTRGYPNGGNGNFVGGSGLRALDYSYENEMFNFDQSVYTPRSKAQAEFHQSYYMYDNSRIA